MKEKLLSKIKHNVNVSKFANKRKNLIAISLFLLVIASCKKIENEYVGTNGNQKQAFSAVNKPITTNGIQAYPLDWENIDFMPTPTGMPTILVPWASGASKQFTPEIAQDNKSIDGWVLLYNTFNTSNIQDKLYFILYNKYRGIIRMYYYLPNTTNLISSANIVHKLAIEGLYAGSSPIMNFEGAEIVDFNNNTTFASTLEQWQVAPSTWYAFEYELAYDPNLSTQNFGTANFIWPITSNQITQVAINGQIDGTLKGNISTPGIDLTFSPSLTNNNGSQLNIKGNSDVEKVKTSISSQLFTSLKGLVTKNLTSIAGGLVEKLFNGIFGGKSGSNADNVNLKVNATVSLTGTLTNNTLLNSNSLSIPGYNQSTTPGFTPTYNNTLGIFYISNKPIIEEVIHITPRKDSFGNYITPKKQYVYTPKISSLNLIFNPAVLGEASIQNIRYESILRYDENYEIMGGIEYIGETRYASGSSVGTTDHPGSVVGIRVTFDVIPNSGSPKSVITKTFLPIIETTEIHEPEGQEEW